MKKKFYHRRSVYLTQHSFLKSSIIIAIIILLALFRIVAPSTFLTITSPLFYVSSYVNKNISYVFESLTQKQELVKQNGVFRQHNQALLNENRALLARINSLTELLGTTTPSIRGIVANVIARPPESPYDMLIIDAGTKVGSAVGDVVIAQGGIPIGTINEVSTYASRVILFSSPNATTTAWVGTSHYPIILKGTGSGTFSAQIIRQTKVTVGDMIFVPGIPQHAIGRIVRIDTAPAAVIETLRIKPFVNIFSLATVLVTHYMMP